MRGKTRELLSQVPLFSACTGEELDRIARLAKRVSAGAGETFMEEGQPGGAFYVIERGTASVSLDRKELARLADGDFFGEMALIDQGPRSATVQAQSDMELWMIEPSDFDQLLDDVPFVARQILRVLSNRLRALEGAPQYQWNR
ncbi:MAG TPA: cyclic nucleotide-binding domain-containing protein [Actinomycetota bacterium]|nr:cyclic nucleotide-binding domain-containing protein [Actinomycetota bacterium]